jgi:hypothetical protein
MMGDLEVQPSVEWFEWQGRNHRLFTPPRQLERWRTTREVTYDFDGNVKTLGSPSVRRRRQRQSQSVNFASSRATSTKSILSVGGKLGYRSPMPNLACPATSQNMFDLLEPVERRAPISTLWLREVASKVGVSKAERVTTVEKWCFADR